MNSPPENAIPMTLYPTLGSLKEVIALADSLPAIISKNEIFGLLMIYHNTLLKVLSKS